MCLTQERYLEKVIPRFGIENSKKVSTPLAAHFKLSTLMCLSNDEESEYMSQVPYASVVGSLIYVMVAHVQTLLIR